MTLAEKNERKLMLDVIKMMSDVSPIPQRDFEPMEVPFSDMDPYAPENGVCEDDYEFTCPWISLIPEESPDEERKQGGSPLNF